MIIRDAKPADADDVRMIAEIMMRKYPMRPDASKVHELVTDAIAGAQHYVRMIERGRRPAAVLGAMTGDNLWAQRKCSHIVLWWSRKPGAGAALLRDFRGWVESRRAIKVAGMHPDIDLDPRALALAQRIGFEKHGGAYLLYN